MSDIGPTVDRIIREAMERGEFTDLPGEGKPIPGAGQHDDDLWWVRNWLLRNSQSAEEEPSGNE